ncbi:MAG: hypothetical protein RRX93_04355 [Bacteroidales bacterium]
MATLKLDKDDYAIDPNEIRVLALQCPLMSPHTLAHFLNKKLHWSFRRLNDYKNFSLFGFADMVHHIDFFLIANKSESIWLPKLFSTDYFLLSTGTAAYLYNMQELQEKIENMENIFSISEIPTHKFIDFIYFYEDMADNGLLFDAEN